MKLSDLSIEELEHKLTVAEETILDDEGGGAAAEAAEIRAVLDEPTTENLRRNRLACDRLYDSVDIMMSAKVPYGEVKPLLVDLYRAGFLEEGDGKPAIGRRIRTRIIDGKQVVTGY